MNLEEATVMALQGKLRITESNQPTNPKELINKIKAEPRTENYEKGMALRDKIVDAWKNHDLATAYKLWEDLHDLFSTGFDSEGNHTEDYSEEQAYRDMFELTSILDTIENKCVYDVTDYGKEQAYREMGYLD